MKYYYKHIFPLFLILLLVSAVNNALLSQEMDFESYNPQSTLVVPENLVTRAKYPFVDIHSHQSNVNDVLISRLIKEMDEMNMATMVNLSGKGSSRNRADSEAQEYLSAMIRKFNEQAPGRFIVFTNLSFNGFGNKEWREKAVAELETDVRNGANGLKIFKSLGLNVQDVNGERVPINHPDLDAIWAKCGELGIPVLIHAADPASFWDPMDGNNERWLELKLRPNRKRAADNPAPFDQIIAEQHAIFKKHRNTTFINAHMGWMANDLAKAAKHLDEYPNVNFGIAAVIAEFGRQPRAARKFFIDYQDRILFGKDAYNQEEFYTYFRVLETEDEYFPYYKKYHAYWRMYGLGLPDEVLKKVYYKNALRIVPNMDKSLFPY
ncbi:amidohydrolase family protein [uncultured Cyclobacterium sp.]|uniref:amidohydrolase family protein n=1 Tax=uncultured Cyclobacterium sp. TaxID=453820 RepID=UPI0030EDE780|tara:strand:+ start:93552 stop:94688 length:1137 start_codon:yes stop_codon:yes gene_type:complete